jgi:hypothetical protein
MSIACALLVASPVFAQAGFLSGSDGSDGALNITADREINLALAVPRTWDTASPVPGRGVYDADQWAVVFKYTTINIASGATVTFRNHSSGAPIVWLATSNVTINGTVNLNGDNANNHYPAKENPPTFAEPGPGGFSGGRRAYNEIFLGSGGMGPGGAQRGDEDNKYGGDAAYSSEQYGYSGSPYGNPRVFPLMGGSGGGASYPNYRADIIPSIAGGGAGGGAILIATSAAITIPQSGRVSANGGSGGETGDGSGGGIRLVADRAVTVNGTLQARELFVSTYGRIRLESNQNVDVADGDIDPDPSIATRTGPVFPGAGKPVLKAVRVDGATVPTDPDAGIETVDVEIENDSERATVHIEARNIPVGARVTVFVVPARGDLQTYQSTPLVDDGTGRLTATATIDAKSGRTEIQLRAAWVP